MRWTTMLSCTLVLALAGLAAACSSGGALPGTAEGSPTPTLSPAAGTLTPTPTPAEGSLSPTPLSGERYPNPTSPPTEGSPLGGLEVRLTIADLAPHVGAPLQMTLTLHNGGGQPVRLLFATSQRYDFLARDDAGNEVWRWSADKLFAQVLGEETLAPGGTLTFGETWDQRDNRGLQVAPGRYQIEGVIVGCPPDITCRLSAGATVNIAQE